MKELTKLKQAEYSKEAFKKYMQEVCERMINRKGSQICNTCHKKMTGDYNLAIEHQEFYTFTVDWEYDDMCEYCNSWLRAKPLVNIINLELKAYITQLETGQFTETKFKELVDKKCGFLVKYWLDKLIPEGDDTGYDTQKYAYWFGHIKDHIEKGTCATWAWTPTQQSQKKEVKSFIDNE